LEINNSLDRDARLQKRKFLICAPSYSQNNGGAIVLHKLCHLINTLGEKAYLFPYVDNVELNKFNYRSVLFKFLKNHLRGPFRKFKTIPSLITPVLKNRPNDISTDEWIVVYPEMTFGNPLGAKNVVRWILHDPGFHTNKIYYGKGELYFRISDRFNEIPIHGSIYSDNFLQVFHYPTELYNLKNTNNKRFGTAYCLRKGKNKKIIHDLSTSILIDGMSHEKISQIFKKVNQFISYDEHTTYSYFAGLCGCDSIVVPTDGVTEEEWLPNPEDRYGISYGFNNIEKARKTRALLPNYMKNLENQSILSVQNFLTETENYFK
jgi:hypothetical protein